MTSITFYKEDGTTTFVFTNVTDWRLGSETGAITIWHHEPGNSGIKYKSIVPLTSFERMTTRI